MEASKEDLEKIQRYEDLKILIAEAEEELNELKPEVLALVPEDKELATSRGVFVVQKRAKYTYSAPTEALREQAKAAEDEEKASGDFKSVTYTKTLFYNRNK